VIVVGASDKRMRKKKSAVAVVGNNIVANHLGLEKLKEKDMVQLEGEAEGRFVVDTYRCGIISLATAEHRVRWTPTMEKGTSE
jgi:hypothetical protein